MIGNIVTAAAAAAVANKLRQCAARYIQSTPLLGLRASRLKASRACKSMVAARRVGGWQRVLATA